MGQRPSNDNNLLNFIAATVETMRDQVATKGDISRLESDISRLEAKLEAKTTAIRGDLEQVHLRLDTIERALPDAARPH